MIIRISLIAKYIYRLRVNKVCMIDSKNKVMKEHITAMYNLLWYDSLDELHARLKPNYG